MTSSIIDHISICAISHILVFSFSEWCLWKQFIWVMHSISSSHKATTHSTCLMIGAIKTIPTQVLKENVRGNNFYYWVALHARSGYSYDHKNKRILMLLPSVCLTYEWCTFKLWLAHACSSLIDMYLTWWRTCYWCLRITNTSVQEPCMQLRRNFTVAVPFYDFKSCRFKHVEMTISGECLTPLVLTPWYLKGPLGGLRSLLWQGVSSLLEFPTDSCHFFCTPGNPCVTPIVTRGEGSFSYQGVSIRGVGHSPVFVMCALQSEIKLKWAKCAIPVEVQILLSLTQRTENWVTCWKRQ